jgi:hypothetical protein
MVINKALLKRELTVLAQYFIISLIAALWAYNAIMTDIFPPEPGLDEFHMPSMLRVMWQIYLFPFVSAFLTLSILRLLYLLLFDKKSKNNERANSNTIITGE